VVVVPFAFPIAVLQLFKPLWSHMLLHNHEPSLASVSLCFKLLLMLLLQSSQEFVLEFPSPRHLSLSGSCPLDLSGLEDPTGSSATADLALRVTGTSRLLHHSKVEIPLEGHGMVPVIRYLIVPCSFASRGFLILYYSWCHIGPSSPDDSLSDFLRCCSLVQIVHVYVSPLVLSLDR